MPSYYELLGVEPDADQDAIHTAFAEAIRAATHPEGGPGGHDRQLDEAYAVIGEPSRRVRYDELRATEGARGNPELLALLAVIADTGSIPTADEVLAAPLDPLSPSQEGTDDTSPHAAATATDDDGTAPAGADTKILPAAAGALASPVLAPIGTAPTAPVPGTDGDRGDLARRRSLLAVVLIAVVGGVVAGLLLRGGGTAPSAFAVGDCVALEDGTATAVACDDETAAAQVVEVAAESQGCQTASLGTVDLGPDGVGCLEPVESAEQR